MKRAFITGITGVGLNSQAYDAADDYRLKQAA